MTSVQKKHSNIPSRTSRGSGHVKPKRPDISLDEPGRLRTAHVLALAGFSHSTLYARIDAKRFPPPDGRDGGMLYWNTSTIREYLES